MISPKIKDAVDFVFTYASHIDDWLVVKKELLKILPSGERTQFSLRHPITKKQRTNDLEREIAKYWSELTGREVLFTKEHVNDQQEDS
jgi:hypothetical protein